MNRELYREIWSARFEKMLGLELEAVQAYQELLEESRRAHPGHPIGSALERLILDEMRHAGLVRELIEILARQP